MDKIRIYLETLELKPGATPAEIKERFHEMLKVWHPDRFERGSALEKRANKKTQDIIEAYKYLKRNPSEAAQNLKTHTQAEQKKSYEDAKRRKAEREEAEAKKFAEQDARVPATEWQNQRSRSTSQTASNEDPSVKRGGSSKNNRSTQEGGVCFPPNWDRQAYFEKRRREDEKSRAPIYTPPATNSPYRNAGSPTPKASGISIMVTNTFIFLTIFLFVFFLHGCN